MGISSVGMSPYLQINPSKGERLQCLQRETSVPWGLAVTPCWKFSVIYADHEDWVIKTQHQPAWETYYSPLLLIELELRFHTAKSSDLFCLLESQSLSGL